jgi:hypothetical protein
MKGLVVVMLNSDKNLVGLKGNILYLDTILVNKSSIVKMTEKEIMAIFDMASATSVELYRIYKETNVEEYALLSTLVYHLHGLLINAIREHLFSTGQKELFRQIVDTREDIEWGIYKLRKTKVE